MALSRLLLLSGVLALASAGRAPAQGPFDDVARRAAAARESGRLEEAARVDGATRWQAFIKIAVPVAAPGLLAAGVLGFILSWNEFLFALVLSQIAREQGHARLQRGVCWRERR